MLFNKTDVIVHLAALTSLPECESNPAECLSVNVAGTASVLKAAKDAGVTLSDSNLNFYKNRAQAATDALNNQYNNQVRKASSLDELDKIVADAKAAGATVDYFAEGRRRDLQNAASPAAPPAATAGPVAPDNVITAQTFERALSQAVSDGTGSSPTGFLKKQVQVTGSDRLFVRLNVTQ